MEQFVSKPMKKSYFIQGYEIKLQLKPGVFCPSEHGSQIAKYVSARPDEKVLDMGTGTGLLGIIAAKQGGTVEVSDISKKAVNLALKNAELNGVTMTGYVGEYFPPQKNYKKTYDYIIANLPQEILPEKYAKKLGRLEQAISGGPKGNKHLLTFLEQAHNHMTEDRAGTGTDARILMVVYSVSDYLETLQKIRSLYNTKLLDVIVNPAKDFVQENIHEYMSKTCKHFGLFEKDGVWQSTLFVYELRKKSLYGWG